MVSQIAMTRARLYILIDAFENDMRQVMVNYVLDHLDEEEALGHSFARANQRRASDPMGDETSITAFLDLQEAYDILNVHRDSLPAELGRELRENTAQLNQLAPIRNRVMHGRPLQAGDPEAAISACRSFTTRYWPTVGNVLTRLAADATWQPPVLKDQDRGSDRILHNLPLPEFDETGLIGRADLSKKVQEHLLRRREPIITLVGEGGIGKTALALDVAYNILDNPDSPYECLLWVSLKTERLTAAGVVEIAGAVKSLTGAANRLGKAFDTSFRGGVEELSDAIEGIPTLLILDNLETVTGDEVSSLYDNLPDSVTFLFTSRVGIGQLERRIVVRPLAERDASRLFRNFAKARGVNRLANLTERTVSEVIKRLRNGPLAIRWYIMAVEAGQQPNLALADQSTLLDFCVRSVYERMSGEAKGLLAMLFALDRMVSFDEMVILAEMSVDGLRKSIQALLNGSMVVLESDESDSLNSKIVLTESARNFLRAVSPPRSDLVEATLRRERDFRRSEERRRADKNLRQLAPNVVRVRTPNDSPTAHLLREALSASRSDTFTKSIEHINRARSINPEFWEVDRVEAFLLSAEGYVTQATTVYRNALRKARDAGDEEGIAVVSYYFAGHLSRQSNEPEQAMEYARVSHQYFQSPETAQELGKILMWTQHFEEAQYYLEESLEKAVGKTRLIAMTTMIDSWKRWSENLLTEQRRPSEAVDKAYAGFSLGAMEISSGTYDERLTDRVLDCAGTFFRCATSRSVDKGALADQIDRVLTLVDSRREIFSRCRSYRPFIRNLASLSRVCQLPPRARLLHDAEAISGNGDEHRGGEAEILVGFVCQWRGRYGFISHEKYPENVFFPASSVRNLRDRGEDIELKGRSAQFAVDPNVDGPRRRASWVEVDVNNQ